MTSMHSKGKKFDPNRPLCNTVLPRGKEKIEKLPCERFLQSFGFSRALLPPVSHGEKCGKFQKPVKIAHKAVILILLLL